MEAKPLPAPPDETSSFYIQATDSIQERWPRTLKSGDMFGLFDALGDVIEPRNSPGGLFYHDTRHLSGLEFLVDGQRPVLLSSAVENDNVVLTVDLSNPDIYEHGKIVMPREILHVRRSKFLWRGTAYERFAIHNFDTRGHRCILTFNFAADFCDLFEIRGMQRARRGKVTPRVEDDRLTFHYQGLDGIARITDIHLDPQPDRLSERQAAYALDLKAGEQRAIILTVRCGDGNPQTAKFSDPYRAARRAAQKASRLGGTVASSNALANRMLHRAGADLSMLITETDEGPYPYAGTPWFSTPFGRDGLITALQMLWIDPSLAQGVLRYLASTQATETDPRADAEPGKILHETRACE
ncbi:MAG TPA: glycogen debranching N-terminal domain-containing protein, partial [Rhizomicrobium sp.]|nr:glycogen debranching N-terminal domain-containing protein [Rhizomicrobium sp.]